MKPVLIAVLLSLHAVTGASAQTAPEDHHDLTAIAGRRTIVVVDDSGKKTQGKLVRFTPDRLLMLVEGSEIAVDRRNVARVFARGDSIWSGMILGAVSGAGLATVGLMTSPTHGDEDAAAIVAFTVIGLGVGTALDALITGKQLVYERAAGPDDFRALKSGQVVTVVSDSNVETSGRLLHFTGEELTLETIDRNQTIARRQITSIFEHGDSLKNGIVIGLVTGFVAGFTTGLAKDDCDHTPTVGPAYFTPTDCYADEKVRHGLKIGVPISLAGAGIGAVIDKLSGARRLVYGKRADSEPVALSIAPSISRAGLGLSTSVSW